MLVVVMLRLPAEKLAEFIILKTGVESVCEMSALQSKGSTSELLSGGQTLREQGFTGDCTIGVVKLGAKYTVFANV